MIKRLKCSQSGTRFVWPAFCCAWMVVTAQSILAQDVTLPTGRVTGHASCADTNEPARFATVTVFPVSLKEGQPDDSENAISVLTDTDGIFVVEHLKDGPYYVIAELPGYLSQISQFTEEQLSRPTAAIFDHMDKVLPKVQVLQGASAGVELRLTRGAAVSGSVRYQDGSPAIGVAIQLLRQDKESKWHTDSLGTAQGVLGASTDDLGHFRISGLVAGNVILKCTLRLGRIGYPGGSFGRRFRFSQDFSDEQTLQVFSGGVFREKDAKPIKLVSGAEFNDADIIIPLEIYHVSGIVTSYSDGHALNDGRVALLYIDTGVQVAETTVERDGSFHFPFVPKGEYKLSADGFDVVYVDRNSIKDPPLQVYDTSTQSLTVDRNLTDVVVQLQAKPTPTQ